MKADWCPYCDTHEDACVAWHDEPEADAVLASFRVIRLQQLREEFEAKQEAYLAASCVRVENPNQMHTNRKLDSWFGFPIDCGPDEWVRGRIETVSSLEVTLAARHYIIARDFGEFDFKRALMLWKLQNNQ